MNFISIDESAIYYEIGYSCDNGLLLSLGDERLFFTDGRYELEAREAIRDGENNKVTKWVIKFLRKAKLRIFLKKGEPS